MKVLIVAHPDDEIIWFNPAEFDRIVIVFGDFGDGRSGDGRRKALKEHPLADKILHLNLKESNYWRDGKKIAEHKENYSRLVRFLKSLESADEVVTHDANGEYGHADHILVHRACMMTLDCSVNGKDPALYRKIRKVYEDSGCWTWH